jgi:hypothetical protein
MQSIKPSTQQTLNDIALMHYGSVVYATDIAHANDLSVTDDIGGMAIQLPEIELSNEEQQVVKEIAKFKTPLATKYPL